MQELKLCTSDYKFMELVWKHEPVNSTQLVKICLEVLGWKKSTTYTMIKKLSQKGFVKNENCTVSSLIPKVNVQAFESEYVVNNIFGGSLPAFIAAFVSRKALSENEINEIRRMLNKQSKE